MCYLMLLIYCSIKVGMYVHMNLRKQYESKRMKKKDERRIKCIDICTSIYLSHWYLFVSQQWQSGTWLFLARNNPDTNLQTDKFCWVYFTQNTLRMNENLLKQMVDAIQVLNCTATLQPHLFMRLILIMTINLYTHPRPHLTQGFNSQWVTQK